MGTENDSAQSPQVFSVPPRVKAGNNKCQAFLKNY